MDFTWYHVIELVKIMFGLTQVKIATALEVSTTTISRLKNDNRKTPRPLSYQDIYRKLFLSHFEDPSDQMKSINEVKRGLSQIRFEGIIKDLDDSSCKSFVVSLLQMADRNRAKDGSFQSDLPAINEPKGKPLQLTQLKPLIGSWNKETYTAILSEMLTKMTSNNEPKRTDSSDETVSVAEISADISAIKTPTITDATQKDDAASSSGDVARVLILRGNGW